MSPTVPVAGATPDLEPAAKAKEAESRAAVDSLEAELSKGGLLGDRLRQRVSRTSVNQV